MIVKIKKAEVDALKAACITNSLSVQIYTIEAAPDWVAAEINGYQTLGPEFIFYFTRIFETQLSREELLKDLPR